MSTSRLLRAGLLTGAALVVGVISSRPKVAAADAKLFHTVNGAHTPSGDLVAGGLTELGAIVAPAAAAGVLALAGHRRAAAHALGAAGAAWVAGQAAKKVFGRPRPYEAHPDSARRVIGKPMGSSWPSSHPAVLLAFTTVAARRLELDPLPRAALVGLAGAVATSRVYLGVHFPSDVAGGLLLGRAVGQAWPG